MWFSSQGVSLWLSALNLRLWWAQKCKVKLGSVNSYQAQQISMNGSWVPVELLISIEHLLGVSLNVRCVVPCLLVTYIKKNLCCQPPKNMAFSSSPQTFVSVWATYCNQRHCHFCCFFSLFLWKHYLLRVSWGFSCLLSSGRLEEGEVSSWRGGGANGKAGRMFPSELLCLRENSR